MPKPNKKKAEGSTLTRAINLTVKLLGLHGQTPADFLNDPVWGSESTVRRLLRTLNDAWEKARGEALFEFVNAAGNPWSQGEDRFIRLKDGAVRFSHTSNLAVIPAYLQLMRLLRGTILEQDFRTVYDQGRSELSKKEKLFLDRSSRKFYNIIKGAKDYSAHSEQIRNLYQGVIQERTLDVERERSDGTIAIERLIPLTIVLYQGGLYLIAMSPKLPDEKPRSYRIESLRRVTCSTEKFSYPASFDPATFFKDTFGIFQTAEDTLHRVELEILRPEILQYLKARRWTPHDQYVEVRGKTRLIMKANDLTEIESWVLGFGPSVKVIGPSQLQRRVRQSLQDAAALYGRNRS